MDIFRLWDEIEMLNNYRGIKDYFLLFYNNMDKGLKMKIDNCFKLTETANIKQLQDSFQDCFDEMKETNLKIRENYLKLVTGQEEIAQITRKIFNRDTMEKFVYYYKSLKTDEVKKSNYLLNMEEPHILVGCSCNKVFIKILKSKSNILEMYVDKFCLKIKQQFFDFEFKDTYIIKASDLLGPKHHIKDAEINIEDITSYR